MIASQIKMQVCRAIAVVVGTICVAAAVATPACASFELVQAFGESGESALRSFPGGIAVNNTTGDVYEADAANNRVLRFDPQGHFLQAWGWGVADGANQFERCGPKGEPLHPICEGRYSGSSGAGLSGEGLGELSGAESIAIDQVTGNVYVTSLSRVHGVIQVFTAEGEPMGGFGDVGTATPAQIENPGARGTIAVGAGGAIYMIDPESQYGPRVMMFEPESPGDYRHYVYAGQSRDLFKGTYSYEASNIVTDAQGDFYLMSGSRHQLYKFTAGNLLSPTWEATLAPESEGLAIDPSTGDLFYYTSKGNTFRRLSPTNGEQLEAFPGVAGQESAPGIAYSSKMVWAAGRPAGVLYADVPYSFGGQPARGLAFAQPAVFPPRIDSESVEGVAVTSASLDARIDPQGYEARYTFQYGSEDCSTHPCSEAPVGGADLGSGQGDITARVALSGLEPNTLYHYRVVASNAFGTVDGADHIFTTYGASTPGLPDGRIYELVSPSFKNGGEVIPIHPGIGSCGECKPGATLLPKPMQAAPDGGSIAYDGFPFSTAGGALQQNEYRASRSAGGWRTEDLSPEAGETNQGQGYVALSSDLSVGLLEQGKPQLAPEAPVGYPDLYMRSADGALRALSTVTPPHRLPSASLSTNQFSIVFAGASADFGHVIFEADDVLTGATQFAPEPEDGGPDTAGSQKRNLYEWVSGGLRLVNVLPGNTMSHAGAVFGSGQALGAFNESAPDFSNAISRDGSKIFWSDGGTGQVYVREAGNRTLEVPDPGRFVTASADGGKVLLSDGRIYTLSSEALTDVTNGKGGFQGILGASDDLSRIYFVDTQVLTGTEENDRGAKAQAGGDNLYRYDAGTNALGFIATLLPTDNHRNPNSNVGDWEAAPSGRVAQVTPDGRFVVFTSSAPITGYDSGKRYEIFEYDASSRRLGCASCNPTGAAASGDSELSTFGVTRSTNFPQPRNLADNGRVFFDSKEVLSAYDVNGSVEDVYEYEPAGLGTCTKAAGCVFLISSGHATADSNFLSASASGDDVFFTTRDQLVAEDRDDLVDLYDARVNGGFPVLTSPQCTGTGCQGSANAPPIFATPSSVTFNGVGNFDVGTGAPVTKAKPKKKAAKCTKHTRLRHGRCVKVSARGGKSNRARRTVSGEHVGGRRAGR